MSTQEMHRINSIEQIKTNPEFQKRVEAEAKYEIHNPKAVEHYRHLSERIEQTYISSPEDDYSLRVRKIERASGETLYKATLKDRGTTENGVLKRVEIESEISEEAFAFFNESEAYPTIRKNRATLQNGVTIDFIDGLEIPLLEIEGSDHEETAAYFSDFALRPVTDSATALNETLAYALNSQKVERSQDTESFAQSIFDSLSDIYQSKGSATIGIAGASGSGKSTIAREVKAQLEAHFGEAITPIIVSTDDYNRGKKYLESTYGAPWVNWDHPLTYDTAALSDELEAYRQDGLFLQRHFDFQEEEVVYDGAFTPSPFIIIEGIHAGSQHLEGQRDALFEMPTGHATSIGRDLIRIISEGRANATFGTPEERLKYQIEVALPTYLTLT